MATRGTPLNPDHWYDAPSAIPDDNGTPQYQAQFGDIYKNVPSVCISSRPLRVSRDWQDPKSGRMLYTARYEDDAQAKPPFDWSSGEQIVVTGRRGPAVLLTQGCEIEKTHAILAFALIRVFDDSIPAAAVDTFRRRERYRSFYLDGQANVGFAAAYVDFGCITSIALDAVVPADRWLSMTDDVRDTLAEDYIAFRTRKEANE